MTDLHFEVCPETGICSIIRESGKLDLLPDEVLAIREANGDVEQVKAVLLESDHGFTNALTPQELAQISATLG